MEKSVKKCKKCKNRAVTDTGSCRGETEFFKIFQIFQKFPCIESFESLSRKEALSRTADRKE